MNSLHIELLKENLNTLNLSVEWVKHSYEQTHEIKQKNTYTTDEFDKLENL